MPKEEPLKIEIKDREEARVMINNGVFTLRVPKHLIDEFKIRRYDIVKINWPDILETRLRPKLTRVRE